ncbi:uncharacterized protein TNCV_429561 [Trichonephila clavipes]|nr:uncharacterized protein TNCV_429561 [Trichonephila clavipes]
MPHRRILAHYKQTSEFERGRIIGQKEAGKKNHADWGCIVLRDESRFQLCPDDHRRCVWRCLEQRADPSFTIARPTGPQPGVMFWGAISLDRRTPFFVIRGTFAAQRYVDDILRTFFASGLIFSKFMPDYIRKVLL